MEPVITSTAVVGRNQLEILFEGEANGRYVIQSSEDLAEWVEVTTITADGDSVGRFEDRIRPVTPAKYFRIGQVSETRR